VLLSLYIGVLLYSVIAEAFRALLSGRLQGLQGGWHDFYRDLCGGNQLFLGDREGRVNE